MAASRVTRAVMAPTEPSMIACMLSVRHKELESPDKKILESIENKRHESARAREQPA